MKLTSNKIFSFMLAAAFALTLAGCGGGGGTAAVEEEPPAMPEPTAQEMCEGDGGRYNADGSCTSAEDLAAEMTEAEALSGAQTGAAAAASGAMAAVAGAKDPVAAANAQMYADAAIAASAAAAAATDSATAMEHQAAAEAAQASAEMAAGERGLGITTTANANANQAAIDSAALVGTPPPAPVSNAGRVSAAIGEAAAATATGANSDGETTPRVENETTNQWGDNRLITLPGVTGASAVTSTSSVTVTASHTGSAPRFSVTRTIDTTGTVEAVSLGRGETPTALTMRGGWAGAELESTVSGSSGRKDYAVVYTDINPPAQSYETQFLPDGTTDNTKHYTATELTSVDTSVTPNVPVYINKAVVTGDVPGDGSHFVGTFNPTPTDNTPPYTGRFFCPANTQCSISVDASGLLRSITGYTFQRTVSGTVKRPDTDYLAWGMWLHVPNALPGVDSGLPTNYATVAAFASGNNLFEVKAALTGTATYNGVATGLYTAGGMVEYFEADASLSADFGGRGGNDSTPATTPADDDKLLFGAVTGTVSNIKAGGMDVDGSLTLGRAPLVGANHDGDDAATGTSFVATSFTGSTAGSLGGSAMSGSWTGRFYGPNKAPDKSVAVRTEFPTTAAGTFGATSVLPGVSILGSFGTWKAE